MGLTLPPHHLFPKLYKRYFWQGLCKYICYLVFSSGVIDADSPFPYFLSKVMVLDVEMFSPWSHFGYICNFYCTCRCTLGVAFNTGIPCCFASSISHMIGNTSLIDCESAIYSASVVDKAISVCIFDDQCMGHPA